MKVVTFGDSFCSWVPGCHFAFQPRPNLRAWLWSSWWNSWNSWPLKPPRIPRI